MKPQRLVAFPSRRGEDAPASKLTREQVARIKRALARGIKASTLQEKYGVTYQTVYWIGIGKTWGDVEPKGRVIGKRRLITSKRRDKIFRWKKKHEATNKQTAERFGISQAAVSRAASEGYAILALRVSKDAMSSGNYAKVARAHGLKYAEVEEMLAYVAENDIPKKLKDEVDG